MSLRRSILAALTSRSLAGLLKMMAPIAMIPVGLAMASGQTQNLSVVLSPAASITAPASFNLQASGTTFGTFTSPSVNLQFLVRNTQASGGGSITLQSTEFSPATGPLIANGNATYLCSAPTVGTACSGTRTLSTTTSTPVLTLPTSACTGTGCTGNYPQTVQLVFILANSPKYKTAKYNATLTFTVSAT